MFNNIGEAAKTIRTIWSDSRSFFYELGQKRRIKKAQRTCHDTFDRLRKPYQPDDKA